LFKANIRMFKFRGDMGKKHHPQDARHGAAPPAQPTGEPADALASAAEAEGLSAEAALPGTATERGTAEAAPVERAPEVLQRLEREAAEWKDRCFRAAAEFENFKKRAVRERSETWSRAQGDLIVRALDALDDLGRIAALDPAQTTSQALHEGAGLVERKLMKALEGVGLERVDPVGQPFDPNLHEAVMTMPAGSPDADHTVGSVLQPGYRMNGMLLRPARVAVCTWTGPAADGAVQ
jgi:molecular chaperone GrpE